jgi:hypothetical protein
VLRALLREATYLPDAVARQYFRRYIVSRFKAYQPKQNATASFGVQAVEKYRHRSFKRRQLSIIAERTSKQQAKARKGLHYLQRANQGELQCLRKVLFFAYGRIGRRKYALLNDLLKPDPIMDGNSLLAAATPEGPTPLQQLFHSNKRVLQYFDVPKVVRDKHVINISDRYSRLRAVLKSQHSRGLSIHRELKGPAMKTPMHNVWMRPMPVKRARNNVRRWYAETMTRLLPPIPSNEWDEIHAMVHKEKRVSLTRRRTPIHSNTQRQKFENTVIEGLKLEKLSKAIRPAGMFRPHAITPKFMQRLYSRILQVCCKVEYNDERKQWVIYWGEPIQAISPSIYSAPTDPSLFAGVDTSGHLPAKPKQLRESDDDVRNIQPRNAQGEYVRFPFFTEYLPKDNPLRKELDAWKRKRLAAGLIHEDGAFRGR